MPTKLAKGFTAGVTVGNIMMCVLYESVFNKKPRTLSKKFCSNILDVRVLIYIT